MIRNLKLTTYNVAWLLLNAGEGGMITTVLAEALEPPGDWPWMQRSNRVNQILTRLAGRGLAKQGNIEPSPLYHGNPVHRWYALPGLRDYVRDYKTPAEQAEIRRQVMQAWEQQQAEKRQLHDALLTEARGRPDLGCRKVRAQVIKDLRASRLITLDEAGSIFSITRERARQIEAGRDDGASCRCPSCRSYGINPAELENF